MSIESFIKTVCVQVAVYWSAPVADGYGGFTFATPTEIYCRWDGKKEVFIDTQGRETVSKAKILVTQDLDEEGYLYLGELSDLTTAMKANPKLVEGACLIRGFEKIPMIKSTSVFVRTVYV